MARKKATPKTRTLGEFRAWLQGVEELQPTGWAPDATQWKLIRKSIDNIVEDEPRVVERTYSNEVRPAPYVPSAPPMPTHMAPPGSVTAPPVVPGSVPVDAVIEMSDEARKLLGGTPGMPGAPTKTKTPDVDSSDGSFASPFE